MYHLYVAFRPARNPFSVYTSRLVSGWTTNEAGNPFLLPNFRAFSMKERKVNRDRLFLSTDAGSSDQNPEVIAQEGIDKSTHVAALKETGTPSPLILYPRRRRRTGNTGATVINGGSGVRSLTFLKDGKHFLSANDQGMVQKWSVDGKEVGRAVNVMNNSIITGMAISELPTRNLMVFAGHRLATVWDMNVLDPDGPNPPMALGQDGTLRLVPGAVDRFRAISLAGNGRFIACTAGSSISLWDTSTSARISFVIQLPSQVWSIAISPDNKYLACSHAGTITLHNLNSIIPDHYRRVGDQLPPDGGDIMNPKLDAARCRCTITQMNDRPQAYTTPRIPDGNGAGMVDVQPLDPSSASQRWTVSLVADGAYGITGNPSMPLSNSPNHRWILEPVTD
ncbi:hypothetical protein EV363DRAFT_1455589 [Boletus edulis]|nr:hypothetical protein EV363DRAFT_1455589 [Boletus edulis]